MGTDGSIYANIVYSAPLLFFLDPPLDAGDDVIGGWGGRRRGVGGGGRGRPARVSFLLNFIFIAIFSLCMRSA